MEEGPNGTHLCTISQFSGPSVAAMSRTTLRLAGSKRLRGDLARKVAKQTAMALEFMHSKGFVHGDLTASNILFQVTDQVRRWPDSEISRMLGEPQTEPVETLDGSPPGLQAPREVVGPVDTTVHSFQSFLEENIIVVDFGQSFDVNAPPKDYKAATAMHYFSPESRFDDVVTTASDIWELACAIFEIRAGRPLFSTFMLSQSTILCETVLTLGKLPEHWWNTFEGRDEWFEENGEPKPPNEKISIRQRLERIGAEDAPPMGDDGPMIEPVGTRLKGEEIVLLSDLLEKMLKYRPEERIAIPEVVQHPWFEYTSAYSRKRSNA